MVKLLDKYVFLEGLKNFSLSLLTFLTLFVVIDLVGNLELITKFGLKVGITYIVGKLPLYTVRVIPIAMLLSSTITISKFSSTSELTVVKALGISLYRFSLPLIILSLLLSAVSLILQEELIPKGQSEVKKVERLLKKKKETPPVNGVWLLNGEDEFIFFWHFDPKENLGEKVSIIKVRGTKPTNRLDAEKAIYLGNGMWKLEKVFKRDLLLGKSFLIDSKLLKLMITPKELIFSSISPETMGLTELLFTIKRLSRIGYKTDYLSLELFSRVSISLLPVVVTLIGIPFGVYNPRNKKGYTVLIAAILIVSMWVTISLFLSLGRGGILPPSYSAFAPLFMFGALGLILLGRVET